jgi:FlaA1/EpsC-like NDP-sugar epimerase
MGSNGSVMPFFMKRKDTGSLPITDPNMTRFNITLREGVQMVMFALENSWGGELYVPKIPSYKIIDVASAIGPNCKQEIVGVRPGEKIHEEMITASDSYSTYDLGDYYVILPLEAKWNLSDFLTEFNAKKVKQGFSYNSKENTTFLSVQELRELIEKHL